MGKSSGGSSSGTSTTVQKNEPWAGLQPYLTGDGGKGLYPAAAAAFANPMQSYPGQTFAPASSDTLASQSLQQARALNGSPITSAMQGNLTDTLSGKYLSPESNPYLSGAFDQGADAVTRKFNQAFSGDDASFGAPAHQAALANGLGNLATNLYGGAYDAERQRQMQANLFAPQAANQDYYDIAKLAEVGANQEGYSQQAINDAVQRFNFGQMEPWQRLQQYNSILNGGFSLNGGTSTTTGTQPGRSIGAGLLGGGLAGASVGNQIMPGGYGAAGGAVLGGLLGGFG